MKGTRRPATAPIQCTPPMMTSPVRAASTRPVATCVPPSDFCTTSATELACTVLPMPKAATVPSRAKVPASQRQRGPRPFLM